MVRLKPDTTYDAPMLARQHVVDAAQSFEDDDRGVRRVLPLLIASWLQPDRELVAIEVCETAKNGALRRAQPGEDVVEDLARVDTERAVVGDIALERGARFFRRRRLRCERFAIERRGVHPDEARRSVHDHAR